MKETPEQTRRFDIMIRVFLAVVALAAILAIIVLVLTARSAFFLATQDKAATTHVVIVAAGLTIIAASIAAYFAAPSIGRRISQRGAMKFYRKQHAIRLEAIAKLAGITLLDESDFGHATQLDGRTSIAIETYHGLPIEELQVANEMASSEAAAFERAGWTVSRYAPTYRIYGLSFVATRADTSAVFTSSGSSVSKRVSPNYTFSQRWTNAQYDRFGQVHTLLPGPFPE